MKKIFTLMIVALMGLTTLSAGLKVAFVYEPGYNLGKATDYGLPTGGYAPSCDPVFAALSATFEVTEFGYAKTDQPDLEALKAFDCVFLSEAMSGGNTMSNALVGLVGQVPVVSCKTHNYTSGRWGWAAPSNPGSKTSSFTVLPGFENHPLFKGLAANPDGTYTIYNNNETAKSNRIQQFAQSGIIAGSLLDAEQDKLYASPTGSEGNICIHEIANAGAYRYILISMSSDNIVEVNENGQQLAINAVNYAVSGGTGGGDIDMDDVTVAYLYDSSYGGYCGIDNDPIFNYTKIGEVNSEAIDVKDFTAADTDTLAALQNYDVVVISEAISGTHAFGVKLVELINRVPIINFKSFFYADKRWSVGAGKNPTSKAANDGGIAEIVVPEEFREDALFADVEMGENGEITMFAESDPALITKNLVQGYTAKEDGIFASDPVLATVTGNAGTFNAIHRHGAKNMYILIPLSSDAMYVEDDTNLSDDAVMIINNAFDMVYATKGSVTPCAKPAAAFEYGNNQTTVTLTCQTADAAIYYTLDGSDPTEASTLYTEPFTVKDVACTLKAIAAKQGNDNSDILTADVVVKAKAAAPTIALEQQDGQTIITLSCETPTAAIYYNFTNSESIDASGLYSEPVVMTYPVTVTAFAAGGDFVASDVVSQEVTINGYDPAKARKHEIAHFDANSDDWSWDTPSGNSKVSYYISKSTAESMYSQIDTIIAGTDTTYNYTLREPYVWYAKNSETNEFNNGWMIKSYGQLVQWEQQTAVKIVGKPGNAAYYCEKPEDLIGGGATDHFITLTTTYSGEGYNATIETIDRYQAPFDIVTYIGNNNSDGAQLRLGIQVSTDGKEWIDVDNVGVAYTKRFWTKRISSYEGSDEVYVRVIQAGGGTKLAVYDVILLNDQPDHIKSNRMANGEVRSTEFFNLNGMRMPGLVEHGFTVVRRIYSNGAVSVDKVFTK